MSKRYFYWLFFLFSICAFIFAGRYNGQYGFFEFYFHYHIDLFVTLVVIIFTYFMQIVELEKELLNGQWNVKIKPVDWNGRDVSKIAEGGLQLLLSSKRLYRGYMFLEWKDKNGKILAAAFYDISLNKGLLSKVTGVSILKIRECLDGSFNDEDTARTSYCKYNLKLSDQGKKLEGTLTMESTGIKSHILAYKDY